MEGKPMKMVVLENLEEPAKNLGVLNYIKII